MNQDEFDYEVALRDCEQKLEALDKRLQAEFMEALEDGRAVFPIIPNTAIRADLVCKAIERIGPEVPNALLGQMSLKDVCRDQKRACKKLGTEVVALQSDQLAAILNAAGIRKGAAVAPVQG
jgi:hypothetical protein